MRPSEKKRKKESKKNFVGIGVGGGWVGAGGGVTPWENAFQESVA